MTHKAFSLSQYGSAASACFAATRKLMDPPVFKRARAKRSRIWKRLVVCRGLLLMFAACSGLLIAQTELFLPWLGTGTAKSATSAAASDTQARSASRGPAQSDQLFTRYPTWKQNFGVATTGQLDGQYWEALVGPAQNSNNEAEYYTSNPTNLRIENAALVIEATHQPEPGGYAYASARVDTQGRKTFLYGRIDVTAKLPRGIGTWPAVWLLPATNTYENLSPSSNPLRYKNGGEIDLIEAVGYAPDVEYGVAHTAGDLSRPSGVGAYGTITVPNSAASYNLYSLLWTPTTLTFEVNNQPFYTYTKTTGADYKSWPFDQPFYLIINLAMGGVWGGQDTAAFPGNGIDNSALPATLAIKSIYYYSYLGSSK